ncbi:hypothetical protein LAT59_03355 [Candidatus Gracilibacteria bacterium]|nr:hypothetical protein [Candidatus Gracilibacteria bacterium]
MKKIFSFLTLVVFLLSLVPQGNAIYTYTLHDELASYDGGNAFIERVEEILPRVQSSQLIQLETRIEDMILPDDVERYTELKLHFLYQEIGKTLHNNIRTQSLPQVEIQKIEADILTMQQSFLSELENNLSQLLAEITASIGTREIGTMSGELYYNIPFFGELNMEVSLNEYIADTENLDIARVRGDVNFSFHMGEEKIESSMKVDLIVQGNDIYILLQDITLDGSRDIVENSQQVVEVLGALGQTQTYIHIGNTEGDIDLDIGSLLSLTSIQNQEWYKTLDSQALLTPVGKVGNTYFLSAHAEMCHLGKVVMSVFDPFSGNKCSERQLENFRSDMLEILDVRYRLRGTQGIVDIKIKDEALKIGSGLQVHTYSSKFHTVNWDITDSSMENRFFGKYEAGKELDFYFTSQSWHQTDISGNIKFQDNYSIHEMQILWEYSSYSSSIQGEINLKDTNLSGEIIGKNNEEEVFTCSLNGVIMKDRYTAKGSCNIGEYGESININGEIDIDTSSNNNNLLFTIQMDIDEERFMDMKIQNTSIRQEVQNLKISTPSKKIALEDLIERVPGLASMFGGFGGQTAWEDDYEIKYNEGEDYNETCYHYDSGEIYCYKYYDSGESETCYDFTEISGEMYCSYSNDEYYYDGQEDIYYYFDGYQIDGKTGERTEY